MYRYANTRVSLLVHFRRLSFLCSSAHAFGFLYRRVQQALEWRGAGYGVYIFIDIHIYGCGVHICIYSIYTYTSVYFCSHAAALLSTAQASLLNCGGKVNPK